MAPVGFAALAVAAAGQSALAEWNQSDEFRNAYGEVGAFETPSARMMPDGQLGFTFAQIGEQQRFVLSFQALPWLDASFRYSHAVGRFSGYDERHFYDRSFGIKARLVREDGYLPDISVGIRDLLGTGIYASEYLVASKKIGPVDISAGMGWGAMSQAQAFNNPLTLFSDSLKNRQNNFGTGGVISFSEFFRGDKVGAFGSLDWQTPLEGLHFIAEYSSDKYNNYAYSGGLRVRSPLNVGLAYKPLDSFALSAGWMYGATWGITLTVSGDTTKSISSAMRVGPAFPAPAIRNDREQSAAVAGLQQSGRAWHPRKSNAPWISLTSSSEAARLQLLQSFLNSAPNIRDVDVQDDTVIIETHFEGNPVSHCAQYYKVLASAQNDTKAIALMDTRSTDGRVILCPSPAKSADLNKTKGKIDLKALQAKLRQDMGSQALQFSGLWVLGGQLWVYYENYHYNQETEAMGRVLRILMADAPASIEIFHVIPTVLGVPGQETTIVRSGVEREWLSNTPTPNVGGTIFVHPASMHNPGLDAFEDEHYPMLSYSLAPKLTQRVFDPDAPIQFLVYADAPVLLQLAPGLDIATEFTGQLWTNYTFTRDAGSALPHVRTDVLKYLDKGKYGLAQLNVSYRTRLTPEVFAEVKGGILEDMYMGGGGQILWRPRDSRFAFGADLYHVWKRGFTRLFELENYNVLTGHVSAYYSSPWYGLNYAVHAGRYLAGDYGATFEITRRFETGVVIGAWATFTNVPFSRFGEGSFDKGIIIHIPFEWGLPIWSQSAYDLRLNSLTRDGGQRLAADDSLHDTTDGTSYGEIVRHADQILNP